MNHSAPGKWQTRAPRPARPICAGIRIACVPRALAAGHVSLPTPMRHFIPSTVIRIATSTCEAIRAPPFRDKNGSPQKPMRAHLVTGCAALRSGIFQMATAILANRKINCKQKSKDTTVTVTHLWGMAAAAPARSPPPRCVPPTSPLDSSRRAQTRSQNPPTQHRPVNGGLEQVLSPQVYIITWLR